MKKIIFDEKYLKELWFSTLTVGQIADTFGCGQECVRRKARHLGLPHRKTGNRGANHGSWKGGRKIDKDGYVLVRIGVRSYKREHRLVMEKHLNRELLRTEVVHHLNGNKQDNSLENLKLFAKNSEHLRESLKGKCPQWSKEGIEKIKNRHPFSFHQLTPIRREQVRRVHRLNAKNRLRDEAGRFLSQTRKNQPVDQQS